MTEQITEILGNGEVRRLQAQTTINAPITAVWPALTDIRHVKHWWADGVIGNKAGEPFQLGDNEDLSGTIIAMRAPHVFEFTWHDKLPNASHPEWIEPHTNGLVRFDLTETNENRTLLTLVQFAPSTSATGAAAGWHELFENIKAYLEKGAVDIIPDRFSELKVIYEAQDPDIV